MYICIERPMYISQMAVFTYSPILAIKCIKCLENTFGKQTLLHSLERAAASISLHVYAHKTEYMFFNQTGDIFTLNGSSLKLVHKFTYLGSSVSSTNTDIDTRLTKAWIAFNSYRSYGSQTWPIKRNAVSSKQRSCRYYDMDALHGR